LVLSGFFTKAYFAPRVNTFFSPACAHVKIVYRFYFPTVTASFIGYNCVHQSTSCVLWSFPRTFAASRGFRLLF
jgi:hypothetical protein